MADETTKSRNERIVNEAKERFKLCQEQETERRTKALDDLEFLDGQQWDDRVKEARARNGRPSLVVNRMDQFVQHITNALAQNRIAARVFPVDDIGDPDTADILQGHLRHIEYNSDADLSYGTAAFYAVASGVGYWMLRTQYVSPYSFETEVILERVPNPFQIYLDPNHRHPAGRDAKYGFKVTTLSKSEYEREYPNSELADADWAASDIKDDDWCDGENIRIAEYLTVEYKPDTLVRLEDGTARLKSELKPGEKPAIDPKTGKPVERATNIETVKWYKINGKEILEETVWPTQPEYVALPIIKTIGNELDINGKQVLKGIIRNLKDAQRQYNYMLSAQTEAVDGSKGQLVIEEGQLEGHEAEWADAANRKVLTVTGKSLDGNPAHPPFRLQPNASIQSMTEARLMAADDLKALTGIYDAALGAQSNETSGRAINSRQAQSETANYHFTGNLVRSVNHSARLIIGAIPTVYDTPRSLRIVGEDDKQEVVKVNQHLAPPDPNAEPTQEEKVYKIGGSGVGKYDVVCEAGPSPATQKEERAIRMTELVKVAPGLMNIAPDLILKDLGGSHELVERVKKSLPPELQDKQDGQPEIPPEVQQQISQMQQQMQQLNAYAQQCEEKLKQADNAAVESKERIEAAKLELENKRLSLEAMKLQAQLDSNEAIAAFKAEVELLKQNLSAQQSMQQMASDAGQAAQQM